MPSEPVIGICAAREWARWGFWDLEADLVASDLGLQTKIWDN